jgi:DNA-binding IclR family transcriptional regulator
MPDATWSRLLRGVTLEARTPNTIVSTKKLRELLQEARENGYAAEREENDMGVMCLANPIRDEYGVVGAISITVPVARGTPAEAELRKHLAKASKAVERDLQA